MLLKGNAWQCLPERQLGKAQELCSYLWPLCFFIVNRYKCLSKLKDDIEKNEGGVEKFTRGYEKFGINRTPEGLVYREWAPAACGVYLTGDFSEWNCFDDCFFFTSID